MITNYFIAIYSLGVVIAFISAFYLAEKEVKYDSTIDSSTYISGILVLSLLSWYTPYYVVKRLTYLNDGEHGK